MKKVQDRKRIQLLFVLTTLLSIGVAYGIFLSGHQGLFWDAQGYFNLAQTIARNGLFGYSSKIRAYGYPLFVSLAWFFPNPFPSTVRFIVFNLQLGIFLAICLYLSSLFKQRSFAFVVYVFCALNPFLLIYTTEVLSDLLSAVFVSLSVILTVKPLSTKHSSVPGNAFLSFMSAGFATMIRPGNLPIVLAVAILWVIRGIVFKDLNLRVFFFGVLGLVLPFVPQVINNYRAFDQVQPLIVQTEYNDQLNSGMQILKYSAIVIPGETRGLVYRNPFLTPDISSIQSFVLKKPFDFLLTQALHLFAFFDKDMIFPYVLDLHPWYRWPLSFANYIFLFIAGSGIVAWSRQAWRLRRMDRDTLIFGGILLGAVAYIPLHVFTAIEERFSLPEYILLCPFFVYGLFEASKLVIGRQYKEISIGLASVGLFVVGSSILSNWVQAQALPENGASPARSRFVVTDRYFRFDDGVELRGYGLDPAQVVQGGEPIYLMLNWRCNSASTEPYEVQIGFADSKGRTWLQAVHDTHDPISPCVPVPWGFGDSVSDVVTFNLPPTMPAGEYRVTAAIFDDKNNRTFSVYDSAGKLIGSEAEIVRVSVSKNKKSFVASQLSIANPYFVDMQEMRLLGYTEVPDKISAGSELDLGLYWRARGKPRGDYLVDVQLRDASDSVVFEQSARPAEGTYPTTLWNQGEVLLDWHTLSLPRTLAPGDDQVAVILQDANSQDRIGEAKLFKISVTQ